jgi:hypothetical protein
LLSWGRYSDLEIANLSELGDQQLQQGLLRVEAVLGLVEDD